MLGSFWNSTFGQIQRAKRLVTLTGKRQGLSMIENAMQNLAGDTAPIIVENQWVSFNPNDVQDAGEVLYDSNSIFYGTWTHYPDILNGGSVRYWLLPITPGAVIPFCIQAVGYKLLVGVDFFVVKDQFILFRIDPRTLFNGSSYLIVCGRVKRKSLLEYPLGIHVEGKVGPVVQYCRNSQTPGMLQKALVEIAGVGALPSTQTLISVQVIGCDTIYTFSTDVIRVSYPHTLLTVGQTYPEGYVIGNAIQVLSGSNSQKAWWRSVNWQGGLSLDPLLSFKGLQLPDSLVWAYVSGVDSPSGQAHVRMPLSNNFWTEKPYWDEVATKETTQGYYLNGVVGITPTIGHFSDFANLVSEYETLNAVAGQTGAPQLSPNTNTLIDRRLVNPLDVFFEAILSSRALVITVDLSMVLNTGALFKFIQDQIPLGVTLVLFCYYPTFDESTYSLQTGSDSVAIDLTFTVETVPSPSPDNYSLSSQCQDWVKLTALPL